MACGLQPRGHHAGMHIPHLPPTPGRRTALTRLAQALVLPALGLGPGLSQAALKPGDAAPDFALEAALGGKAFRFSLAQARQKGPVVVYFYPKAFTSGCTIEAHAFAEATPRFEALGATVIGLSNDDIDTLKKFSVEACRNRFAVAADANAQVMKAYDAVLLMGMADRITYVISPQGRVLATHASLSPQGHVDAALKSVEAWRAKGASG